jgi:tryptophan-rich sensory protein
MAGLFFGAILLSVGAMVWSVGGLPVRGGVAIAGLGLMSLAYPGAVVMAFRRQAGLLLLLFGVALLGAVVSLLNDMPPLDLLQQILEIHLQAAVFLMLATVAAEILGGGAVVLLFVSAVGVSGLLAVAQFFDLGAAWSLRDAVAAFTDEAVRYDRSRPPGLAVTPVALATHLTLALAAVLVWRQRVNEAAGAPLRFDPMVLLATVVFSLVCLVSGNRSPMLGAIVFFAVYSAIRAPRAFLLVAPLVLLAVPLAGMILEGLQGTGMRAFMTGDKSAEGRETLFLYGLQLFLERPIGYGLGFAPMQYWGDHMELLLKVPNSQPALQVELHNYPLTMLNYYGLGILMILPPGLLMIRRHLTTILPFLPYATHILFHNYGPFAKNDFLVFVAFAAVTMPLLAPAGGPRRSAAGGRPAPAHRRTTNPTPNHSKVKVSRRPLEPDALARDPRTQSHP